MKIGIVVGNEIGAAYKVLGRYKHCKIAMGKREVEFYSKKLFLRLRKKASSEKIVLSCGRELQQFPYDFEIYLCRADRGELDAAATTQFLIDKFELDLVVNFGMAHELGPDLEKSFVYFVSSVIHYDFDVSEARHVSCRGCYPEYRGYLIPTSAFVLDRLDGFRQSNTKAVPRVVCASGDKFVVFEKSKQSLLDAFPEAKICDMSSAGVLRTCIHNDKNCLIIKGVTDGRHNGEVFDDFMYDLNASACFEEVLSALDFLSHH